MSKSGHQACAITYVNDKFWEISGYPNGLAGEAIPQAERIALADVFDALTSVRPYKKAWTVEAAAGLIRENRGKHFDPDLVDVFLRELPGIVAIRERFAKPEAV